MVFLLAGDGSADKQAPCQPELRVLDDRVQRDALVGKYDKPC